MCCRRIQPAAIGGQSRSRTSKQGSSCSAKVCHCPRRLCWASSVYDVTVIKRAWLAPPTGRALYDVPVCSPKARCSHRAGRIQEPEADSEPASGPRVGGAIPTPTLRGGQHRHRTGGVRTAVCSCYRCHRLCGGPVAALMAVSRFRA